MEFFSFLRESIREEDVDIDNAEEKINDKSEFGIRRKEIKEELESEERVDKSEEEESEEES